MLVSLPTVPEDSRSSVGCEVEKETGRRRRSDAQMAVRIGKVEAFRKKVEQRYADERTRREPKDEVERRAEAQNQASPR
jgi:hypothetical protein